MTSTPQIRPGRIGDLAPLARLYDDYIARTAITFDLEPYGTEGRRPWIEQFSASGRHRWIEQFSASGRHRLFVADADGEAIGFASSQTFRPKGAYATSVETSIYLARDWTGRGLGARLYAALFDALAGEDVHRAYAGITLPNDASVALHERCGFARVAVFDEVGFKLGRYWSVAWYEKRLR